LDKLPSYGLQKEDVKILEARRPDVPVFIKSSDINVSFIKPVYSKLSSSPTKLGEVLSMGIPVISNSGVGDVEKIIRNVGGGFVFHKFSDEEYQQLLSDLPLLLKSDPKKIRDKATEYYSLEKGIELYYNSYKHLLS
jgi:hypothetical protein